MNSSRGSSSEMRPHLQPLAAWLALAGSDPDMATVEDRSRRPKDPRMQGHGQRPRGTRHQTDPLVCLFSLSRISSYIYEDCRSHWLLSNCVYSPR